MSFFLVSENQNSESRLPTPTDARLSQPDFDFLIIDVLRPDVVRHGLPGCSACVRSAVGSNSDHTGTTLGSATYVFSRRLLTWRKNMQYLLGLFTWIKDLVLGWNERHDRFPFGVGSKKPAGSTAPTATATRATT